MNNKPFFAPHRARLLHFLAVVLNALLALWPVKPAPNCLSSVSWNG